MTLALVTLATEGYVVLQPSVFRVCFNEGADLQVPAGTLRPATPARAVRQQSPCARAMASCDMVLSKETKTERSQVESDKHDDVLADFTP